MNKQRLLDLTMFAMKITITQIALSVLFVCSSFAKEVKGQTILERTFSISAENVELRQVISSIQRQTKVKFNFSANAINAHRLVSYSATNIPITDFLDEINRSYSIDYQVLNEQIVLFPFKERKTSDKNEISFNKNDIVRTVTGQVTSDKGEPLVGITVTEKGTANAVATDEKGRYTILVADDAVLVFTGTGYSEQQVQVAGKTTIDVQLLTEVKSLDDVVVVGYGTRKITDLTGAVSNIRADATNIGGVSTGVDQLLQGRVAGLQYKQNTSQPGGGGTVLIRGRNSLFLNTDPLYVIDGFIVNSPTTPGTGDAQFSSPDRNPLNTINPNDIESIAVLKDAAATAIYGAKGSNGVIIITTKRGSRGKLKVTYDGYYSYQKIAKKLDVMNAQQYMNFYNQMGSTNFSATEIANAKTTDWFDLITRNGQIQSHNLSLSGATDNFNYFFSLGYFNNQGIVKNSGMSRITGRGNVNYKKDKFSFSSNIFTTNIINNNLQTQGGTRSSVIASAITFAPNLGVRDADGVYTKDPNNAFLINPVSLLDITDKLNTDKVNFSVSADYEIIKGLKPEIRATYDVQNDNRLFYVPTTTAYNGSTAHGGTGSQSAQRALGYTLDGLLHYDVTVADKHKITALLGYEYYYRSTNYFSAYNSGFGSDITGANNIGGGTSPVVSSEKYDRTDISAFGRIDYTYNDKYLATLTLRRDGSSVFGENNKFAVFPGISLGWRLDKEDFLANHDKIDLLKLRVGYGVTGNSGIASYQSLSKYNQGINTISGLGTTGILGQNPIVGIYTTPLKANPDLKWESTSQFNIGVDYGFSRRFTGSLDFFVKNTNNMLVQVNLPTTTGYSSQWQNAATMRTTGVEFSISSLNVQHSDFKWNTVLNVSLLNNKITGYKTTDSSTVSALNTIGVIKGRRTNSYYTYIYDGIDNAGSLKFRDIDGNGQINSNDRQIFGSPDPKVILGLGNTISYKRLSLDFFFVGNFGNKLFNQTMAQYLVPTANGIANALQGVQNYWTPSHTDTDIPANAINNGGSWIYNSRWIEDAWFIRLQNLNLSYSLPSRALGNIFTNIRLYAQAQNLFVATPYKGMDPEAANNSYLNATENMPAFLPGSTDISAYPPVKTFTVGVNLGF